MALSLTELTKHKPKQQVDSPSPTRRSSKARAWKNFEDEQSEANQDSPPGTHGQPALQTKTGPAQTRTNWDKGPPKLRQQAPQTETSFDQTKTEADQTETNGQKVGNVHHRAPRKEVKSLPRTLKSPIKPGQQTETEANQTETIVLVSVSDDVCPSLQGGLSQLDRGLSQFDRPVVLVSEQQQTETINWDKLRQLPTSAQQLLVLRYMLERQHDTGLETSPVLRAKEIADALQIPISSVRKQIQRLVRGSHLLRIEARHGRGKSGCIYSVPVEVALAMQATKLRQQTKTNSDNQTETTARSSSFLDNSKTTTTDKTWSVELQNALHKFGLAKFDVGASHALDVWRQGAFDSQENFMESLEHIAFYLNSNLSDGIKNPRAWLISKLREGYFPPPENFESQEERMIRLRIEAKKAKKTRLQALLQQEIELDFDIWLAELSTDQRAQILEGTIFTDSDSMGAKAVLRATFMTQHGYSDAE